MEEKDCSCECCEVCGFNYELLNTHYTVEKDCIVEWNKDAENISYCDFERIADKMNYMQLRIESMEENLKNVYNELYCKDRILEEQNIPIECCDKEEKEDG